MPITVGECPSCRVNLAEVGRKSTSRKLGGADSGRIKVKLETALSPTVISFSREH